MEAHVSQTVTDLAHSCVLCNCVKPVMSYSDHMRVDFDPDGMGKPEDFCMSLSDVMARVREGCTFFEHCLRRLPPSPDPQDWELGFIMVPAAMTPQWVDSEENESSWEDGNDDMEVFALETDPASQDIPNRPLNPEPASKVGWMRQLLKDCEENHTHCGQQSSPSDEMPLRLLAVGPVNATRVFIHEISGENPMRYAALSYPWGQGQDSRFVEQVQTTIDNLQNRLRDGIEVSLLPKTLRDAIWLTRELSIPYLFIDALCITQDDEAHKKIQPERMPGFFSRCTLVFYATRAEHGDSGFLGTRNVEESHGTMFRLPFVLYTGLRPVNCSVFVCEGRISDDNEPLDKRGWAYREERHGPRILRFGPKQTHWQCDEYPLGTNNPIDGGSLFGETPSEIACGDSRGLKFTEETHTAWMGDVEKVSRAKFTCNSDKLPALHSLAEELAAKLGYHMSTDYWDGIWRPDAVRQLQWLVLQPGKKEERSGPSWQWASWESGVHYGSKDERKGRTAHVARTHTRLSLRGFMHKIVVTESWKHQSGCWTIPIGCKAPLCIYWDYQPQPDDVWLLELNKNMYLVSGLVLVEAAHGENIFTRCGLFSINFTGLGEDTSTFPGGICRNVTIF
ncbi:hypothetical protein MCOR25_006327 [Pyricularia grisea]|nr:hypothetical protein MCOR25_006327 [Pyricularia grisea]